MHAPEWVTKELERIHPQARLGWYGRDKDSPEDMNVGEFWLLQLYPKRNAVNTMFMPWEKLGPIWGSPFDPLSRVPMMIQPISVRDVFSGKVGVILKENMRSLKERILESRDKQGKELRAEIDDLAGEMGDKIMHRRRDPNREWAPLADKFLTKEDKDVITGNTDCDERLENFYHRVHAHPGE